MDECDDDAVIVLTGETNQLSSDAKASRAFRTDTRASVSMR